MVDRERFKSGQKEVNQNEDWRQKYEELAKVTNKIYEMQAPALHFAEKQTTPSTKEPINRLGELALLLNELTQRERCANDSRKSGKLEVLELKDLLEEVNSLKETLRREMAISKGLRRTIEKLQEENKVLAKTTKQERAEESKVMTIDIPELREKVHELEKDNELLQQKLTKKDKELERFRERETGAVVDFTVDYELPIFHLVLRARQKINREKKWPR